MNSGVPNICLVEAVAKIWAVSFVWGGRAGITIFSLCARNHGNSHPSPHYFTFYRLELKILVHGAVKSFEGRGSGISVAPWGISDLGKVTSLYLAW